MPSFTFDPSVFRGLYPEFSANPPYTDALLNQYYAFASGYIDPNSCGMLNGAQLSQALYSMTAHIAKTFKTMGATGNTTPNVVTQAGVDKVSAGFATPPFQKSNWLFFLYTTPYGQQLAALLQIVSAGGFQVGGLPELSAFRKVGGGF